jgi:hypothetical protein
MSLYDQDQNQITSSDVDNVKKKLTEFSATLNEKEQTVLMGVLELAGKMYEGMGVTPATKRKLPLVRETIRELNVWDRLLESQGWSLWTCDRPQMPGEEIIDPEP